jgi:hypothetical protein
MRRRCVAFSTTLLVVVIVLAGLNYYTYTILNSKISGEQARLTSLAKRVAVEAGFGYLLINYNASLGLMRDSPDNAALQNTYFLYSDNYLAAVALWNYAADSPIVAKDIQGINQTMTADLSKMKDVVNQYEALTTGTCAFNGSKDFPVKTLGQAGILTTVNNQTADWLPASNYSDIAFLEAICYSREVSFAGPSYSLPDAQDAYRAGVSNLKGLCFEDEAFTSPGSVSQGTCQTYKLALYIYASRLLGDPYPQSALNLLLNMSAPSGTDMGGFYTCYGTDLNPRCGTNVETTALAILALLPVPATNPPIYEPMSP